MEEKKSTPLLITHYCEECRKPFEVPQGSQRRYCNEHLVARVAAGKKKEPND